jgi:hypothetical protein
MSDITHIDLAALLKRLNLATVARLVADFEQRAAKESWTHREFLVRLMAEEVANRANTRVTKLARYAHFPFLKTIEEFDFTFQATVRRTQLGPYLGPECRGTQPDPFRQTGARENAPRRRGGLPGHPERIRGPIRRCHGPHRRARLPAQARCANDRSIRAAARARHLGYPSTPTPPPTCPALPAPPPHCIHHEQETPRVGPGPPRRAWHLGGRSWRTRNIDPAALGESESES